MHILSRAHSSAEYPMANYMLITINQEEAVKLLRWYGMAAGVDAADRDFLRMEFLDYCCEAMEDLPEEFEEHEDALCDTGYVVLDEAFKLADEDALFKRRDFSLVQVEANNEIPSLNGFRWEFGIKHCSHSVESPQIPLDLVQQIAKPG